MQLLPVCAEQLVHLLYQHLTPCAPALSLCNPLRSCFERWWDYEQRSCAEQQLELEARTGATAAAELAKVRYTLAARWQLWGCSWQQRRLEPEARTGATAAAELAKVGVARTACLLTNDTCSQQLQLQRSPLPAAADSAAANQPTWPHGACARRLFAENPAAP